MFADARTGFASPDLTECAARDRCRDGGFLEHVRVCRRHQRFASIPARHDLSRRIDAGYLARLVAEHRLDEDEAVDTAVDLACTLPKRAYQQ